MKTLKTKTFRAIECFLWSLVLIVALIGVISIVSNLSGCSSEASAQTVRRPGWKDFDGDRLKTRQEILEHRCIVKHGPTKRVTWAHCLDAYTGKIEVTSNPSFDLQMDHLLAWSRARDGREWSYAALVKFYNDQDNLFVTTRAVNNKKSDKMPHEWCPEFEEVRPMLGKRYEFIANSYGLPLSQREKEGVSAWKKGECFDSSQGY